MLLTAPQLNEITDSLFMQIYNKLKQLVFAANAWDELPDLLNDFGREDLIPLFQATIPEKSILILGASRVNEDDLKEAAKACGFNPERIDFCCDYARLTNFDINRIRNSSRYSHILVGPVPHSIKGLEKIQNLISFIECNASQFPRLIRLQNTGNTLHISKSSFLQGLEKVQKENEKLYELERI